MASKILEAIGASELVLDPRFSTNAARLKNIEELDEMISSFVGKLTLTENLAHFETFQVTVGPVLSIDLLMQDQHVKQRQVLIEVPDEELGTVMMHNVFPVLSKTPGQIRSASPKIGEHQALVGGRPPD